MIQETSCYPEITGDSKTIDKILTYIREFGPVCDRQIAQDMGIIISTVTAARNHLVRLGQVEETCKAVSPITGKRVIFWSAP